MYFPFDKMLYLQQSRLILNAAILQQVLDNFAQRLAISPQDRSWF